MPRTNCNRSFVQGRNGRRPGTPPATSATSIHGDGRTLRHLIRPHLPCGGSAAAPETTHRNTAMTTHHDPDDEQDFAFFDDFDFRENQQLLHEEIADYNDSLALSNEDGWFYSDDD